MNTLMINVFFLIQLNFVYEPIVESSKALLGFEGLIR